MRQQGVTEWRGGANTSELGAAPFCRLFAPGAVERLVLQVLAFQANMAGWEPLQCAYSVSASIYADVCYVPLSPAPHWVAIRNRTYI